MLLETGNNLRQDVTLRGKENETILFVHVPIKIPRIGRQHEPLTPVVNQRDGCCAPHLAVHLPDRRDGMRRLLDLLAGQGGHDLGIHLGRSGQLPVGGPEVADVDDDPVVDHGDTVGKNRLVVFVSFRRAVCDESRVAEQGNGTERTLSVFLEGRPYGFPHHFPIRRGVDQLRPRLADLIVQDAGGTVAWT